MVTCEECWRAETPLWRRVLRGLDDLVFPPSRVGRYAREHGLLLRAAMGVGGFPSAYDRHKAEYEHTGDPMELERMLRHIK